MRAIRTHVALSVRLCVGDDVSSGRQTRVGHLVSDCGGAHIRATWRIREIDLCSDCGDVGCCYHYYSCCCCCDAEKMLCQDGANHGTAPSYPSQLVRVAHLPGRRSLRSARTKNQCRPSNCLLSTAGPPESPDPPFATVCSASVDLPSASENVSVPGLGP